MAAGKLGAALAGVSPVGWVMGGLGAASTVTGLIDRRRQKKAMEAFEGSKEVQDVFGAGRKARKKLRTGDFGPSLAAKRQQRMEAKKGLEGTEGARRAAAKRLRGASAFGAGAERRELDRLQRQSDTTYTDIASQIDKDARAKAIADRQFALADRDRAVQMRANLAKQEAAIPGLAPTIVAPMADMAVGMAKAGVFDDSLEKRKLRQDEQAARRAARVAGREERSA